MRVEMEDKIITSEPTCTFDEEIIFQVLIDAKNQSKKISDLKISSIPKNSEFHELDVKLHRHNQQMKKLMYNPAAREVSCYKRLIAPFVIFFRKVLRKFFLKWYIEPICTQQSDFNIATHNAVSQMTTLTEKQLETINLLFEKCTILEEELKKEKALSASLEARLKRLEGGENL